MKIIRYSLGIGVALSLMALQSCSTISSITAGIGGKTGKETVVVPDETESTVRHDAAPSKKGKPHGKRKVAVKTGKPSHVETAETSVAEVSEGMVVDVMAQLGGEWVFSNVRGRKVTGDERPHIIIDGTTCRFYGSNGCNVINGDVVVKSVSKIVFDNIISTTMSCDDADFEHEINGLLSTVSDFSVKRYGQESYLDLMNSRRQVIAVLRRHDMAYVNGLWSVVKIDGKDVDEDFRPEMVIDIPELRIHGNTGCNLVNGTIYVDSDKDNSIQFQGLGVTRMACPAGSVQTEFLVALESVETVRPLSGNSIVMSDKHGRVILELHRKDAGAE